MGQVLKMIVVTRSAAKKAGLVRYCTGKPCKHGHLAERLVCSRSCVVCVRLSAKKRQLPGGPQYRTRLNAIRRSQSPGGSQHESARARDKRRKSPGGPQRHSKIAHNRRWRSSGSPAAINLRFLRGLRARYRAVILDLTSATATIRLHLGCTVSEARAYLESLFHLGMTWDNHGVDGWHIDHVRPLASFDRSDPDWQREAFHYTNLQPLWAADNIAKGARYAV